MRPAAAEASESHRVRALAAELRERVLFRDEALLVLDKPPGLAAQVSSTFMEEFSGECTYAYRIYQYILGTILGIVQGWPRRAAAAWACRWTPRCRCCASGAEECPRRGARRCRVPAAAAPGGRPGGCLVHPGRHRALHRPRWRRRRPCASMRLQVKSSRH